jgi:hypothetical protein
VDLVDGLRGGIVRTRVFFKTKSSHSETVLSDQFTSEWVDVTCLGITCFFGLFEK